MDKHIVCVCVYTMCLCVRVRACVCAKIHSKKKKDCFELLFLHTHTLSLSLLLPLSFLHTHTHINDAWYGTSILKSSPELRTIKSNKSFVNNKHNFKSKKHYETDTQIMRQSHHSSPLPRIHDNKSPHEEMETKFSRLSVFNFSKKKKKPSRKKFHIFPWK